MIDIVLPIFAHLPAVSSPSSTGNHSSQIFLPNFSHSPHSSEPISPSDPALILLFHPDDHPSSSSSSNSSFASSLLPPSSTSINGTLPIEFTATRSDSDHPLLWAVYTALFVLGIVLNCAVLWRMSRRVDRREKEQRHNSIGAFLRAMACIDLAALCALFLLFLVNLGIVPAMPMFTLGSSELSLRDALCKGSVLIAHSAYSQSMWCWVFMSALRYFATRRPLQYFALWRVPHTDSRAAIALLVLLSAALQGWLLFSVHATSYGGCVLDITFANRVHAALDVIGSFAVPFLLLFQTDIRVLCRTKKYADPMLHIVINRPNGEKKRNFHHFMLTIFISMMLNVPGNLYRFSCAIGILRVEDVFAPSSSSSSSSSSLSVSNLLWLFNIFHIAQFTFNALYLHSFVHERCQFSKSNSSRQLSISIRQRLEDGGEHFIRERASTISYRANTPMLGDAMAQVKGSNSCWAIEFLCPPPSAVANWV